MRVPLVLTFLTFVLCGCFVIQRVPPAIEISNLRYASNFQDRSGAYVICHNLETSLTYSFEYLGYLESRTSVLVGETTGEVKAEMIIREDPPSGPEPKFVTFEYILLPGGAPLAAGQDMSLEPDAVVVEPVPGPATRIRLTIRSSGGFEQTFTSRAFPVVSHC